MQNHCRSDPVNFFAVAVALIMAGCASVPPASRPLAPEIRAELGRIAITKGAAPREFFYELPNPHLRREALSDAIQGTSTAVGGLGAAAGLGYALARGANGSDGVDHLGESFGDVFVAGAVLGQAAGLVLAPVGVAVGTLHDAVLNETPAKVRSATPAVVQALRVVDFEDELSQRIRRTIQTQTGRQVTPASVAELDATRVRPTLENRYRDLRAQGFDTVIVVSASGSFEARVGWHNPFRLQASCWFTVVDLTQHNEIYSGHFEHRSKARKFISWAKDDGKLLKNELELCYEEFTRRIMRDIFADSL